MQVSFSARSLKLRIFEIHDISFHWKYLMIKCHTCVTFILCVLLIQATGCRKNELNRRTDSSEDHALAQRLFADVFQVSREAVLSVDFPERAAEGRYYLGECAAVVIEQPRDEQIEWLLISADFSEGGCVGNDGVTRIGKLQVSASGPYREVGSVTTVQFQNYAVDNFSITGMMSINYLRDTETGHPVYEIAVAEGEVTNPEGDIISWECLYTWIQLEGLNTEQFVEGNSSVLDDVYSVTGFASGQNHGGRAFTTEIVLSLEFGADCGWMLSGKEKLRPDGLLDRELSYGSGNCDAKALVEIGDESHEIFVL